MKSATLRVTMMFLALVAMATLVSTSMLAAQEQEMGKVVSAGNGLLIMTDDQGANQRTHQVAEDAEITLDGEPAELEDLKQGFFVQVTLEKQNEKTVATAIDAQSQQ